MTSANNTHFHAPISEQIWDMKYRLRPTAIEDTSVKADQTIEDTWHRIANALAEAEHPKKRAAYACDFYEALSDFKFLPAGRILSGAGAKRSVTLFNCFVMSTIPDRLDGIFEALKEAALTMQQGGGIGYDFSTLRPKGAPVKGVGADASGPLSFMDVWNAMCQTIMSAGSRRGAMMATMRCDHPDIIDFITAKSDSTRLRMFNLSVLITDDFMQALKTNADWDLRFGDTIYKTIPAKDLWNQIMRSTYDYAEPGVIFIDRINKRNNLHYCEKISATNPCGEQPLPPYGACLLGSINLAALVTDPFTPQAKIDTETLTNLTHTAIRMMDNVVDVSGFPLSTQEQEAKAKRRIGLGITGLADALAMVGLRYGSDKAIQKTKFWMKTLQDSSYSASINLAEEKGAFPLFEVKAYLAGENIKTLDKNLQERIKHHGIRNALLTSIAPTGTISLLAGNVSSGIEPIFATTYKRKVLQPDGTRTEEEVLDYAVKIYHDIHGIEKALPDYFVTAQTLNPEDHVKMQAAAQTYIDSSISKTINVPADISFEGFQAIYKKAYDLDCKGCTTYRPNEVTGSILSVEDSKEPEAVAVSTKPSGDVVYLTDPLKRPEGLHGSTYKLQWPESQHAMYITVNDIEMEGTNGPYRRPFEVFINSKNMEHYAWTVALTRMVSAVFRRGGDVSFVVEELQSVFDPRGGAWMNGRYVPSILAAIGNVIEQHLLAIGFISSPQIMPTTPSDKSERSVTKNNQSCSHCGSNNLHQAEGCASCLDCGFSKCA